VLTILALPLLYVGLGTYLLWGVNRVACERFPLMYADMAELWSTRLLRRWMQSRHKVVIGFILIVMWPLVFIIGFGIALTEAQGV